MRLCNGITQNRECTDLINNSNHSSSNSSSWTCFARFCVWVCFCSCSVWGAARLRSSLYCLQATRRYAPDNSIVRDADNSNIHRNNNDSSSTLQNGRSNQSTISISSLSIIMPKLIFVLNQCKVWRVCEVWVRQSLRGYLGFVHPFDIFRHIIYVG